DYYCQTWDTGIGLF
nr:immunoglobulin light chain junction region [Macaca mulatta]MOW07264.1 immunoglobulin light chain junction region [Macaca mulatta]